MIEHDLPCREVVEHLSAFLDGTLDDAACEQIELHLVVCGGCSAYFDGLTETVRLLGRLDERLAQPAVEHGLRDTFRRWRSARGAGA